MKTKISGKNLLFIELIVVILFFSVAAAACVALFGQAYRDSNHSRDLTSAVIMAQNAAEMFKATGGINETEALKAELDGAVAVIKVYNDDEVVYELTVRRIPYEE